MYNQDSIELFLDLDVLGDQATTELNSDDRQFHFGPRKRQAGGEAHMYVSGSGRLEGIRALWLETEDGYNLEIALPWEHFIEHGAIGQPAR